MPDCGMLAILDISLVRGSLRRLSISFVFPYRFIYPAPAPFKTIDLNGEFDTNGKGL